MLTFNLKKEFYDMVISRIKDTEYREYKEYWVKRIGRAKLGDFIKLVKGYTSEHIEATITKITIMTYEQLPEYAKKFFGIGYKYYAVQFKINF